MTKRMMILLTVVCLLVTLVPFEGWATELASGDCGDDLVWSLDSEGTLTISGSGEMWDYGPYTTDAVDASEIEEPASPAPWSEWYGEITRLELSPDITYIGECAFWSLTALEKLTIPEGVEIIDYAAFAYCTNLTELELPDSLLSIDYWSFNYCEKLAKVTFHGDAPECSSYTFEDGADGMELFYHSSASGWEEARENWYLPQNAKWYDLDAVIGPEDFGFDQHELVLKPGESVRLNTNADAYTDTLLQWDVEGRDVLFFSESGVATAIRPGSATIAVRSDDGVYQDTCHITITDTPYPSSRKDDLKGAFDSNRGSNDYWTWSSTRESFLAELPDGGFERVQYFWPEEGGEYLLVLSRYDGELNLLEERYLDVELPIFGGFFAGENHNYLLFGQSNTEETDEVEVLRIVRYSKDWNRLDSCSVYGANTQIPFRAGGADFAESNGKLYLHTCHQMYKSSDGLNHQANMTFVLDQATMTVEESYYRVEASPFGYCSHSFSQFVRAGEGYVFTADHGDAYPRAIKITRAGIGDGTSAELDVLEILGATGANATGVSLGGLELSSSNCLVVGNSVDQSDPDTYDTGSVRNVFLAVADQELTQSRIIWLTDYTDGEEGTACTPHLVKVAENIFMVLWEYSNQEDRSERTNLMLVDGNGEALCEPVVVDARLSDCQPIVTEDGLVTWFSAGYQDMTLFRISWRQLLDDPDAIEALLDHRFGAWEVYTYGNCAEPNVEYRVCQNCNRQEYREGELAEHDFVNGACRNCGAKDPNPFRDVDSDDYFYKPVLWAVENGITSGISANRFAPGNSCTRAQVVTFLWRAAGEPEPVSNENPFRDVKASAYYYQAVLWAVENGITTGMSATSFGPDRACTRGQVVTFLWRAAGEPETSSAKHPFSDVRTKDFYYKAVLWAVDEGITTGISSTSFGPGQTCTRGQVVTFLYRAQ